MKIESIPPQGYPDVTLKLTFEEFVYLIRTLGDTEVGRVYKSVKSMWGIDVEGDVDPCEMFDVSDKFIRSILRPQDAAQ